MANPVAIFSSCRRWRYWLRREVQRDLLGGGGRGVVNFCLLNPSDADETKNDPTVAKLVTFASDWGYDALEVTNIFAWRSTDPGVLADIEDPIGPENDAMIVATAKRAQLVICGWGVHGWRYGRGEIVRAMLREAGVDAKCLRMTDGGHPYHPLYLPRASSPIAMVQATAAPVVPGTTTDEQS